MSIKPARAHPAPYEPKPGEWMEDSEFAQVVRLTPLVAFDLVVRSPEGRVLVGRRTNEPAKGSLFVPGGRISKNEHKHAAFRRISREELGVEADLERARFLGIYEHFYPTNRLGMEGFGTHYIVLAHELFLDVDSGSLPRDQHTEYYWMSPAEILNSPEVHENTKAYFR